MGKNVIVSEGTIRDLLEAHAALSAWYYELSNALRAAGGVARTPDDAMRSAFVERLAEDFPEVASVVRSIGVPRLFVPPPPPMRGAPSGALGPADEPATVIEPAAARLREATEAARTAQAAPPAAPGLAPPPLVDPAKVKYE